MRTAEPNTNEAASACDCGAVKAKTTHANWCTSLNPEAAASGGDLEDEQTPCIICGSAQDCKCVSVMPYDRGAFIFADDGTRHPPSCICASCLAPAFKDYSMEDVRAANPKRATAYITAEISASNADEIDKAIQELEELLHGDG